MVAIDRRVFNPLALAALAWLDQEPMHRYEIGRRLEDSGETRYIKYNQSSLYMVIEQLHKAGFVMEQGTTRQGQRPQRTVYAITELGRSEFLGAIRILLAQPHDEYPHFAAALSLMRLLGPDEAAELLGRRLSALHIKADQTVPSTDGPTSTDELDQATTRSPPIEDQYALAMIRAEADFVTRLMHSLSTEHHTTTWPEIMGRQK